MAGTNDQLTMTETAEQGFLGFSSREKKSYGRSGRTSKS